MISEYVHVIPTLEVYPRIYYFNKRYNDLLGKLNKLRDKHQKVLYEKHRYKESNVFQNGLEVKVIGKSDLRPDDFLTAAPHLFRVQASDRSKDGVHTDYIIAVDPFKDKIKSSSPPIKSESKLADNDVTSGISELKIDGSSSPDVCITICYANVDRLDDAGFKEVKQLSEQLLNSKYNQQSDCLLFCRPRQDFAKAEHTLFEKQLAHEGIASVFNHVVIGQKIGEEVSNVLESDFAQRFVNLQAVIQQYTKVPMGKCERKPIESDVVVDQIYDFLHYSLQYNDEIEEVSEEKNNTDLVIKRLARTVRCALVHPLSNKYNLPVSICNNIMIENDFERKVGDAILKNELERLQSLYKAQSSDRQDRKDIGPAKSISDIVSSLLNEFGDVVMDISRKLNQFSTAMKKMQLEITACLKKIKVNTKLAKEQVQQNFKMVDKNLKKDILSMNEVYGVGSVYGQLEVHVNNEADVKKVESVVGFLLRKKKLFLPFLVRTLESKPSVFADCQYEHGGQLICSDRSGTLGGFLDGSDSHLYGITCAHVVEGPGENDVFFSVKEMSQQRVLFARSVPHMIVSTGEASKPLIDLAVVRVIDNMKHKCTKFMKDDEGRTVPAILPADTTLELVGNCVYKHGAVTQCTKGIVCSDDYGILSAEEVSYVILIDNYNDDDDQEHFARQGDSGSMICTPDENEVYVVKAAGVFSAGEFTPADRETPLYFSFRLLDGLRKLTSSARGVQFSFPQSNI